MKFEKTEVWGTEHALRGMRNPMNSWSKSDSKLISNEYIVGDNDMDLARRLIKGGNEHSKFMRMIHVAVDITAPLFWWSEADTYHFNTKNSQSTMHKLLSDPTPLTVEDFTQFIECEYAYADVIGVLNKFKETYKDYQNKDEMLRIAKCLLPSGYLQMRTVDTNYAEIRNMYFQRRHHRLPEWSVDFVNWVKTLPLAEELIMYEI